MYSDIYNTTVNVNGNRVFSSTYTPGYGCGCCRGGMFGMNSCFGFGFYNPVPFFAMGTGFMAGIALAPELPSIFKGIGKGLAWFGTRIIAPAAVGAWKGVSSAASWIGNGIAKGASAVANGVSNIWNKIFHKKSKVK